jgi:hypothetical protein
VLIALVDDGMDLDHEDLASNTTYSNQSYLPESFHFNDSKHGTAVAGIIAARDSNGVGIRGVAPRASLGAYNALRTPDMLAIADALTRQKERVAISNNSWGDFNSWGVPFPLNSIIEDALNRRDVPTIAFKFSVRKMCRFSNVDTPHRSNAVLVSIEVLCTHFKCNEVVKTLVVLLAVQVELGFGPWGGVVVGCRHITLLVLKNCPWASSYE